MKKRLMEPEYNREGDMPTDGHGAEIAAVIFASTICAIVAYVFGFGHNVQFEKPINGLSVANSKTIIQKLDPFITVSIQAKAAYVWDVRNQKVLFAKNADDILPLASITKIMTADVASELLAPTSTISINQDALLQDGDNGLLLNERWTFRNLLDFTLAVSSNDGAFAIASAASPDFVGKMNEKAQALGLTSMHFYNPTGLDESLSQSGAYSSATDLAKLFVYTLQNHPEIFNATRYARFTTSSIDGFNHTAINTDEEINNIPGIIGSKTGYTDLAGGNLAVVYDASINYPIVVVVLGSTYDGRFSDVTTLIQASNQVLSLQK